MILGHYVSKFGCWTPVFCSLMAFSLKLAPSTVSVPLVSTSTRQGSYIVSLASTPSSNYAALATNTSQRNAILIYSMLPTGLSCIKTLSMPSGSMPSVLRVVRNFGGRPMLVSAHQCPGSINVWDERTGAVVMESQSIELLFTLKVFESVQFCRLRVALFFLWICQAMEPLSLLEPICREMTPQYFTG